MRAADVHRVGLTDVDEAEADPPLGLLPAHALPERDPGRRHLGQPLDALDRRAADMEDLEEGAPRTGGEGEHAREDEQEDRERDDERRRRHRWPVGAGRRSGSIAGVSGQAISSRSSWRRSSSSVMSAPPPASRAGARAPATSAT